VNNLFDKKTCIALFVGFFALEAILSVWTGMQYDMNIWFNTGKWMQQGINIYMPPDHVGYPPLWPFWCDTAYRVYLFFGNNLELWRFTIKLPLILANLALAFAVGTFAASRFNHKTARRVFLFVLTWSFFIFIGAMWGQINTLSALLTFLAFYAITQGRTKLSALLLGLAITLKIYPLIVLPAFFAYVLKNKNGKEAGKGGVIFSGIRISEKTGTTSVTVMQAVLHVMPGLKIQKNTVAGKNGHLSCPPVPNIFLRNGMAGRTFSEQLT